MKKTFDWKEFLLLNAGVSIMALGIYFFKFPNNFSTGGVSGIAVIISGIFQTATPGNIVFMVNMLLLAVGYLVFGKGFGLKTTYASFVMSGEIWLLERLVPMSAPFTDEPLLELIFAVMLPAFGSAILFNIDASSGGTDIAAMVLKKFTNINIGRALLCSDLLITIAACFVFDMKTGLFSIVGLAAKALVVDSVIESFNMCKFFTIITTKPQQVSEFIVQTLHRGATMEKGYGAFTHEDKTIIITAVRRAQAVKLQRYVRQIDQKAFILITNTSEIIGKGFRGAN